METTPINTESTFSLSASAEQHTTSIFSQRIERIRNSCPYCGSVNISRRTRKKDYLCSHCRRSFSLTVLRTTKDSQKIGRRPTALFSTSPRAGVEA